MQFFMLNIFAEVGIPDLINSGTTTAKTIAESWDKQWIDLLQTNASNNLYKSLTNLGIFFAVGTFLFFMIQWLRDLLQEEYARPLSALIWPFIVVILLNISNNGSILSSLTLAVRGLINNVNQEIVVTADAHQTYQQALNMSVAEELAGSFLRPCESLTGQQQNRCFTIASQKIQPLWQEYRSLYGDQVWIIRLENKINQIRYGTYISENNFDSLLGSTTQTTIKSFLISLQYAFQNLIEATMLLIAVLGPLAVGSSLLPVAGKPIFAWMIGFLSLGIAKISFNIIAIITASVIVNGPGNNINADPDLLWFIIFMGILAPILSLIVAIAGGFAIFMAVNTANLWIREKG